MITGGIKFFNESRVLAEDDGAIVASSGDLVSASAIDKNPITFWTSVGSNDVTTETLTLTFNETEINRLFLVNHNWKEFNVQYWTGLDWAHFSSVRGLDGVIANVSETSFSDDTSYYEFETVTTTKLKVEVLKTQVANEQKFISQIIATTEVGTLNGFPKLKRPTHSRNERTKEMLSRKVLVQKGIDSFGVTIDFDKYPVSDESYRADLELAMALFDREDPFLVWLCGGRRGTSFFRYTARGMRLRDIYLMQITKDVTTEYLNSGYLNPLGLELVLREHV